MHHNLKTAVLERLPGYAPVFNPRYLDFAAHYGFKPVACNVGRSQQPHHDRPILAKSYRRRHRIENFFERIKRYRRVATRYDKLAETFLGFVCLAILCTLRLR